MTTGHYHPTYSLVDTTPIPGFEDAPAYLAYKAAFNSGKTLRAGFTSVIGAGCTYNIDVELEMAMAEGVVEGPRIVPCSPHILATGADWPNPPWWLELGNTGIEAGFCTGADEFRKEVRRQVRRGVRMIKLIMTGGHGFAETAGMRNVTNEELRAAVDAAHERGAMIRTHTVYRDEILECIDAGVDIVDHADEIDGAVIEAMVEHGTFFAPTVNMRVGAARRGVQADDRVGFDSWAKQLRDAAEAGVRMIPGDDYGPKGFEHASHMYGSELAMMVDDIGLDPVDVIRIATANGGAASRFDTGVVEAGMLADLVVVRGDPSREIALLADPEENVLAIVQSGTMVKSLLG